jgi:broad specificity phosphatase PhoE
LAIERVLIIRHGQTDWNIEGRWQGTKPVPLNAEGWTQARAVAHALCDRPIHTIISSDLSRALQTATAIGELVGVQPQTDERWREFNLGIFQGHTRAELIERYPQEWQMFETDYWNYLIPDGESRRQLQERVVRAWEDAVATSIGPEVVIVSHGGAIKMLLLKLFADTVPDLDAAHFGNTSISTIEYNQPHWQLTEIASVRHLSEPKDIGESL